MHRWASIFDFWIQSLPSWPARYYVSRICYSRTHWKLMVQWDFHIRQRHSGSKIYRFWKCEIGVVKWPQTLFQLTILDSAQSNHLIFIYTTKNDSQPNLINHRKLPFNHLIELIWIQFHNHLNNITNLFTKHLKSSLFLIIN